MRRSRSVVLGLLVSASIGATPAPSAAPPKGLESILVTGDRLREPVPIDSVDDLRAICSSIRVVNAASLRDSTLPPAAKDTAGAIYLAFYGATIRTDIPPDVHVAVVRPPAKPGALAMITMLPGSDDVVRPEQFCMAGGWVVERANPTARLAAPGVFVMDDRGAAVLRRYGVFGK